MACGETTGGSRVTHLQPAADIAVIQEAEVVYIARLPDGPILVLEGAAALIWNGACSGSRESLTDRLASGLGAPDEDVKQSVEDFVEHLLEQRLLIRVAA